MAGRAAQAIFSREGGKGVGVANRREKKEKEEGRQQQTTGETFPGRGHRVLLVQRQTGTTGSSYNEPKSTAPYPPCSVGPDCDSIFCLQDAKCVQAHLHIGER